MKAGTLKKYNRQLANERITGVVSNDNSIYSKFIIDKNDIPFLGKRENLPFNNIECYTYKHSEMTWDEFYRQGDSKRGISVKVLQNGKYGVIYRCQFDWDNKI